MQIEINGMIGECDTITLNALMAFAARHGQQTAELERLRAEVAQPYGVSAQYVGALQAEIERLRAQVADCQRAMVELSKSNTDVAATYSAIKAERDDLAAKLETANAELHELRIRGGSK